MAKAPSPSLFSGKICSIMTAAVPVLDKSQNTRTRAYFALVGGVLSLTLSPLFVRWSEAPGLVTSFYKMFITPVLLTPVVFYFAHNYGWPQKKAFLFPIAAGIFSAIDHGFWATALAQTTVANATLLNNLSPLWVGLFALIVWQQKLHLRFWFGLFAAFIGVSLVLGSNIFVRTNFACGDLLAILSSVFYAGFSLITQKGRRFLSVLFYLWAFSFSGAACLFLATRSLGMPLAGYSPRTELIFLATSLIAQLCAYSFITYALGTLPASIVAPTMVLQPVLTALLAIPFVGEGLVLSQVAGGLLTLGGIYLVNAGQYQ